LASTSHHGSCPKSPRPSALITCHLRS
jgi:hypothetical protein